MREAPNCAEKCEKRLIVRIYAGNGLKCENVRETAKSAMLHPRHFIFASVANSTQFSFQTAYLFAAVSK